MFSMCKELSTVAPFIIVTFFFPLGKSSSRFNTDTRWTSNQIEREKGYHGDAFGFSLLAPS